MNYMKLHILMLIDKYKRVTDVAAELGLKQPTVSFHMKSLEAELGTALFEHRSGRVLLTDAGRTLLPYAVKIVSLTAEAERSVTMLGKANGKLELAAAPFPSVYVLPNLLALFMKDQPGAQVSISTLAEQALAEKLRERSLALALLHEVEEQAGAERGDALTVATDETVMAYSASHRFATIGEWTPDIIAQEPLVSLRGDHCIGRTGETWAKSNGVQLWTQAKLDSPEAVKALIRSGAAAGLFPKSGLTGAFREEGLEYRPLPGIAPPRSVYRLVWRKELPLSPSQKALVQLVPRESHI